MASLNVIKSNGDLRWLQKGNHEDVFRHMFEKTLKIDRKTLQNGFQS